MNAAAYAPVEIAVRIDRLVVETDHAVNAFALQRALTEAIQTVVIERGVPAAWTRDAQTPTAVVHGFPWDGLGGEPGLARALAMCLYDAGLAPEVPGRPSTLMKDVGS